MIDLSKSKIIKHGICLYASEKEYDVIIIESSTYYGTGDYEDTPEIADDANIICYCVCFENLTEKGLFNQEGRCFLSIDEAIKYAEMFYFVRWI